jgi:hypothetical protein
MCSAGLPRHLAVDTYPLKKHHGRAKGAKGRLRASEGAKRLFGAWNPGLAVISRVSGAPKRNRRELTDG